MDEKITQMLIEEAVEARKQSFSPFSGFAVGAALMTAEGAVYRGCNIECSGLTASNCAERTAFFKAVSEGERNFKAIAIVGGPSDRDVESLCYPCGICRQVMAQFCDLDSFRIIVAADRTHWEECTLRELLPRAFHRHCTAEGSEEL